MSALARSLAVGRTGVGTPALEAAAFLAIAIGVGWSLMLLGTSPGILLIAMWVPGLAALVLTRIASGRCIAPLGLDRLGWPDAYLWALWLPVLFAGGGAVLTVLLGAGRFTADLGGLRPASGELFTSEISEGDVLIQRIVNAITLAPFVNLAVLLGSELGWRGYLLPRLLPAGKTSAIAITSLFWWLWQAPLTIAASTDRWIVDLAILLVWCMLVGTILGWLYLRTKSPWAPALFSSTLCATADIPSFVLQDVVPTVAGPVSLIGWIIPALVVLMLVVTRQLPTGD